MKKTVRVVMLPTTKSNKDGDIVLNDAKILEPNQVRLAQLNVLTVYSDQPCTNQHLYLISDDEIKEGDWYIATDIKSVIQCNKVTTYIHGGSTQSPKDLAKKIIATTDNSINVNYPIAEIPESFIQAYIKAYNERSPITEVAVEVIIGQGQENGETTSIKEWIKTRSDNTVIIHQAKMYTRDEVVSKLLLYREFAWKRGVTLQDLTQWIQDNL